MKKILLIICLLMGAHCAKAQMPTNAQKQMEEAQKMLKQMQSNPQIKAAMQKAQHVMDSLKSDKGFQKQMASSGHLLDSMKKTNLALANVKIFLI